MYDEDLPTHQFKDRRSEPNGDTQEANELAEWLRARVGTRSLRKLAVEFPSGRTQWNDYINGRKLIPADLLKLVVDKLVPPGEQERQRKKGLALLEKAKSAAKSPNISPGSTPREYEMRLDDVRRGQIKAQEAVHGLTNAIWIIMNVVTGLKQRCTALEAERDQVRLRLQDAEDTANQQRAKENSRRAAEDLRSLNQTEQDLAENKRLLAELTKRLDRAQREKEEAEGLRIEALQQVEEYRRALIQLTGRDAPAGPDDADLDSVPFPQLREGEYDRFLEIADRQLDLHTASMNAVREQIGLPVPSDASQETRTIPGQVVPSPSTDSTDTATASGNPVPVPSTDSTDTHSATPSASIAPQGRGPVPPTGTIGAQSRRKRRGLRAALIGAACLALIASGGWVAWDHYHPDYGWSDSKALRDARKRGHLRIGVKAGQPGLSEKNSSGKWEGLDIRVAEKIAEYLDFKKDEIRFIPTATADREEEVAKGKVDFFVGSYSITKKRKEAGVEFAGPYLLTDQRVLVYTKSGNPEETYVYNKEKGGLETVPINSVHEFKNGTRVCTTRGSITKDILKKEATHLVVDDSSVDYLPCVEKLRDGSSSEDPVAVITDAPILLGFAKRYENLAVIRDPIKGTKTSWGVGLVKGDPALKQLVCESIAEQIKDGSWDRLKDDLMKDAREGSEDFYIEAPREEKDRTECLD
ncbi:transporter substrate-binding domain-containing protein [Streptomyces sp. NPDC059076]|uniref:transporter substrate-binding domain-containing protein n=1 Tax=unclassified Streptomyces TaxID=2593676 RepID=UPI0036AF41E1